MKKIFFLVIVSILFPVFAHAGLLQKLSDEDLKQISLPGYSIMDDQAFKMTSGPLSGKTILFGAFDPETTPSKAPALFVLDNGKLIDSRVLPNLVEGWNIVDVTAVTALPGQGASALRILAIMTMEPISNRPADYWTQAFVFDVGGNGKIEANADLNKKLAETKQKIKTIEALKAFLSRQP